MRLKWVWMCVVCVATTGFAQDEAKPAEVTPAEAKSAPAKPKGESKGGLFSKKPKVVVDPVEEAKKKAEIEKQIQALPTQGTPMLDETGKQMLDPDAKPMFNPPPQPLLDKKGQPALDEDGKLLLQTKSNLGYDKNGKKLKPVKVKEPKKVPVTISQGTLTVDGWTGKARLNYDIPDLKYIYIYAPGVGNTIISNSAFDGATEQKNAFDGKTLTVNVEDHMMQIASDKPLLGKGKKPLPAYVRVDREFTYNSRFPVMGYGTLRKPPYAWPGAKEVSTKAPDLPKDVKPVIAKPTAPKPGVRPVPGLGTKQPVAAQQQPPQAQSKN